MTRVDTQKNIRDYVATDFRTAAVFSKYKIDFCCKGDRSISEVCEKKKLDLNAIVLDLNRVLNSSTDQSIDYKSWPSDLLADYVQKKHHRYIEEKTPVLRQFLDKLCKVHGGRHPELFKINELFIASTDALLVHMKEEETLVFPLIREMVEAKANGGAKPSTDKFGSIENPIAQMLKEHTAEGDRFREISQITDAYTPPADACNTYRVAFKMLQEFEEDLHLHIHLENNILFLDAIAMEKSF